ncbi:MAG TPA: DUF1294 domain-containing protein [Clostridia bacterium]|nr:DUF1294 domain-containing protein [Clostridia bacterium]
MKAPFPYLIAYLIFINLFGFILMGLDKRLAQKSARRIRERTLFLIAIFGGSLGSLLGMYAFHHKTKKNAFRFGIPAILLMHIAIAAACYVF